MNLFLPFYFFIFETMRNVGIDIAKKKIDVFIPPSTYQSFPNNKQGFSNLLNKLERGDVLGVESTGTYHHDLALFFLEKGFEVRELNPILTNQFIRTTIRKKKTDKTDAKIICLLLNQGEGYPMKKESINNVLQKLVRSRRKFVKMRTALKLQLQQVPSGKAFSSLKHSLKVLIKAYDRQIENLETETLAYQSESVAILESIPGISFRLSREIISEIGAISRFKKKEQIVAYGGFDPKLKQSGTTLNSTGKLTKRGSPHLRNALYLASFANIRSQNVFSLYYRKKKGEGKHHYQAMTATSRKMLEIIFALLSKKERFSLDFS